MFSLLSPQSVFHVLPEMISLELDFLDFTFSLLNSSISLLKTLLELFDLYF